jgi:hypothetical protein
MDSGDSLSPSTNPMRNRAEAQLSAALRQYLEAAKPRCVWCAIPNASRRNIIVGTNLKRQGMVAGAADWVFTWESGAGWIELKTDKGRVSLNQLGFQEWCKRIGVRYEVARSLEDCINVLKSWERL